MSLAGNPVSRGNVLLLSVTVISEPVGARRRAVRPVPWAALGAAAALTALPALAPASAGAASPPAHAKTAVSARPAVHAAASARSGWKDHGKAAVIAGGTPLVADTFKDAEAPGFTGYNDACLTGAAELPGGHNPPGGDHPVGGCGPAHTATGDQTLYTGPVPPRGAPGFGYLELTNARDVTTIAGSRS